MSKKSSTRAILGAKCPRCREGDMFQYPFSKVLKFHKMYTHCPVCNLRFEVEPGFFFGAMYISYAFTSALLLSTAFILYYLFDDPHITVYIAVMPFVAFLFMPPFFRYSRVVYMYLFSGISYDNKYGN